MIFVDDEAGQRHSLYLSAELEAELEAYRLKFDCNHARLELRRRTLAGETIQIKNQRLKCGRPFGNAFKQNETNAHISLFDEAKESNFKRARKLDYLRICRIHNKIQSDKQASHQIEYAKYLASPAWKEKQQRVLKRANGICEGCL